MQARVFYAVRAARAAYDIPYTGFRNRCRVLFKFILWIYI